MESSFSLWFGMLGGALAWLVHLLGATLIAEWGYLAGWGQRHWGPFSVVAWVIIFLSLATVFVAVAATWVAHRQQHQIVPTKTMTGKKVNQFLADTGKRTSALFVFIILVQSVPVLFYLRG